MKESRIKFQIGELGKYALFTNYIGASGEDKEDSDVFGTVRVGSTCNDQVKSPGRAFMM